MSFSAFVRRLNEGCTFADFITEWAAGAGFGVPTRGFQRPKATCPR